MDITHLHLIFAHFPIIGTIFGFALLAYGYFTKNMLLKKTALVTFIIVAIFGLAVFLTGDGTKETVQNLPGITEKTIDTHEELAEKAIWFIGVLGAVSLIALYFAIKNNKRFKMMCMVALIISILTMGMMVMVGYTGGQIRHIELIKIDHSAIWLILKSRHKLFTEVLESSGIYLI